jgi:aminopeptidase-like protein
MQLALSKILDRLFDFCRSYTGSGVRRQFHGDECKGVDLTGRVA